MPRYKDYHLHLPAFHLDSGREMRLLFGVRVLRDLIIKIALFFIPIYLYNTGSTFFYTFAQSHGASSLTPLQVGILTVTGYYFLIRLIMFFFTIFVVRAMQHRGIARMMALSHFFYLLTFAFLLLSLKNPWYLVGVALADGLQATFFWTPYTILLARNISKSHVGEDLGFQQFIFQLLSVFVPALAGLSILYLGYQFVFFVGIAFILASLLCVLAMKNAYYETDVSFANLRKWLQVVAVKKIAVSFAGRYMHDAVVVIWPLYVFLILGAVERVGYLYSISLFIAMVFSLFIGSYIDHHRQKKWFFVSGSLLTVLWLVRSFITTIWTIAIVDVIDKLAGNFYGLFFDAQYVKAGKGKDDVAYFTYREVCISAAALLLWPLIAISFMVPGAWMLVFMLAAAGVGMSMLVENKIERVIE